jgi:hypothetical protein
MAGPSNPLLKVILRYANRRTQPAFPLWRLPHPERAKPPADRTVRVSTPAWCRETYQEAVANLRVGEVVRVRDALGTVLLSGPSWLAPDNAIAARTCFGVM